MKLQIRFGIRALVGANDGLAIEESAKRYADALRDALLREWPDVEISIDAKDDRAPVEVTATGCASEVEARAVERTALDLAWVVKHCADWAAP
jgi:hypothetical protein